MTTATYFLWTAEQACAECGRGVFVRHGEFVLCDDCGHMHDMDTSQLGENERFEWTATRRGTTLHVTAYETEELED